MKPRGGEGQNGRLKCPMGFLVSFTLNKQLRCINLQPIFCSPLVLAFPTSLNIVTSGVLNCKVHFAC